MILLEIADHFAQTQASRDIPTISFVMCICVQSNGWTPLHMAAWSGHLEVVAALIAANANVDAADVRARVV